MKQSGWKGSGAALLHPSSEGAHCCSRRTQTPWGWGLTPKGPHSYSSYSSRLSSVQIPGQQNVTAKVSLDVKPKPGVMSHDRHESGVFTSSISQNSDAVTLSQDFQNRLLHLWKQTLLQRSSSSTLLQGRRCSTWKHAWACVCMWALRVPSCL